MAVHSQVIVQLQSVFCGVLTAEIICQILGSWEGGGNNVHCFGCLRIGCGLESAHRNHVFQSPRMLRGPCGAGPIRRISHGTRGLFGNYVALTWWVPPFFELIGGIEGSASRSRPSTSGSLIASTVGGKGAVETGLGEWSVR